MILNNFSFNYSGNHRWKILWSRWCIKQWAEDLRIVFPRKLIEMPYNKSFGCIVAQKSVQTTFIQLMTLKLVSKIYLEVTCDFHPFPIELTAWGKKITAVIKSRAWRWRLKWMVTFSQPVNSPYRHTTKRWEVASVVRSGKDEGGLIRLLSHMQTCSQGLSSFQRLEMLKDPWNEVGSQGTFTRPWGKKYHRDALLMRAGGWN